MPLLEHELLNLCASLVIGLLIGGLFRKRIIALAAAFMGAVLIDLDHLFDYFLAFNFHFKLNYFLKGYEFLKNDKIFVLFHAWESVVVLLLLSFFAQKKNSAVAAFSAALALGLFFHLMIDTQVNHMYPQSYSLIYRVTHQFETKELVPPEEYNAHAQRKLE